MAPMGVARCGRARVCERDWAGFECGRGMGGAWTVVYPGRLSSGWGVGMGRVLRRAAQT